MYVYSCVMFGRISDTCFFFPFFLEGEGVVVVCICLHV